MSGQFAMRRWKAFKGTLAEIELAGKAPSKEINPVGFSGTFCMCQAPNANVLVKY